MSLRYLKCAARAMTALATLVICLYAAPVYTALAEAASDSLDAIHARVVARFPTVSHMAPERLLNRLEDSNIIVFDVREADEFGVSRLPHAHLLLPNTSSASFHNLFGDRIEGRTVVFYCTVGVRSSVMAERLQPHLERLGAQGIYNLQGGIIAWHNGKHRLVSDAGQSDFIHPFDNSQVPLVDRADFLRYRP